MSRSVSAADFSTLEGALNQQINLELTAAHEYLAMHAHFAHDKQAFPGLAKFFFVSAHEEREHAEKLIKYMIERGGTVKLSSVPCPQAKLGSAIDALDCTIDLENKVSTSLEKLVIKSDDVHDSDFSDYLTTEFIREQHSALKKLSDMYTQLKRAMEGNGLGAYLWDQNLLKSLE